MLRIIILQDAPFLKKEFPSHPIWHHPVFQHEDYPAFEKRVLEDERLSVPVDQQKYQYQNDVSLFIQH